MTTASRLLLRLAILLLMSAITMGWAPTPAGADGQSWAIVPSPNYGSGDNYLYSVACVSTSDCTAVGYYDNGTQNATLILHWDGATWAQVASPTIGNYTNILNGVTCVSASDCTAVGNAYTGVGNETLIVHWDGTSWTRVNSPNVYNNDGLSDVSCVSANDCTAVGQSYDGAMSRYATLILHWNGLSWTRMNSPTIGAYNNFLNSISCVAASDCTAVGYRQDSRYITMVMRWDGSTWSEVASPNVGSGHNFLSSVACVSSTNCTATGYEFEQGHAVSMVFTWDGSTWSPVAIPTISTSANALYALDCVSATSCTAAGYFTDGNGTSVTLILRWDGTSWTQVTSPNVASTDNTLVSIDCVSPSECTAIGDFVDSNAQGRYATLIERSIDPNPPLPPTTSTTTTTTPTEPVVPTFTG